MAKAYCVKCKATKEIKNPKAIIMKNKKPATQGVCPTCSRRSSESGRAEAHHQELPSLVKRLGSFDGPSLFCLQSRLCSGQSSGKLEICTRGLGRAARLCHCVYHAVFVGGLCWGWPQRLFAGPGDSLSPPRLYHWPSLPCSSLDGNERRKGFVLFNHAAVRNVQRFGVRDLHAHAGSGCACDRIQKDGLRRTRVGNRLSVGASQVVARFVRPQPLRKFSGLLFEKKLLIPASRRPVSSHLKQRDS